MLPAQPDLVHHLAVVARQGCDRGLASVGRDAEVAFGEDDDARAGDGVFGEGFANDFFAAAVRVDVGLREGGDVSTRALESRAGRYIQCPRC
jgi:hypothetical protein